MRLYFLLLLFLAFAACRYELSSDKTEAKVFSIAQFIQDQIDSLEYHQSALLKTGTIAQVSDTVLIKNPDWKKELQAFTEADFSNISSAAYYQVDSLHINQGRVNILYTATNDKLPVKSLDIIRTKNKILRLKISIEKEHFVYHSKSMLEYYPKRYYRIETNVKTRISKVEEFVISGRFINP